MYTKCTEMIIHHWNNVSPHFLSHTVGFTHGTVFILLMEIIKKNFECLQSLNTDKIKLLPTPSCTNPKSNGLHAAQISGKQQKKSYKDRHIAFRSWYPWFLTLILMLLVLHPPCNKPFCSTATALCSLSPFYNYLGASYLKNTIFNLHVQFHCSHGHSRLFLFVELHSELIREWKDTNLNEDFLFVRLQEEMIFCTFLWSTGAKNETRKLATKVDSTDPLHWY